MTPGIPWRPIAELPDALKDGREILVGWWERNVGGTANPRPDEWCCVTVQWRQIGTYPGYWDIVYSGERAESSDLDYTPTHFAEINPPEGA